MTRPRSHSKFARWQRVATVAIAAITAVLLAAPLAAPTALGGDAGANRRDQLVVKLNPARGRTLFIEKGCIVCHSINGIGGATGPRLDPEGTAPYEDPFEFAARMWRGMEAMMAFQRMALGYQIILDGRELADIAAFVRDRDAHAKLTESDIPPEIRRLMRLNHL